MSVLITCEKCGTENRLGTMFCRQCGEKLNLNAAAPKKGRKSSGVPTGTMILRLVRLALVLALVVVLGMLCWGTEAPGDAPGVDGSQKIVSAMSVLRNAVIRKVDVVDSVSEADVNAYINGRIVSGSGGTGFLKTSLEGVSLDLQEDRVVAWLSTKMGPIPLTYQAEVSVLRGSNGNLRIEPGAVSIGRLTMPGPLRNRVINQFNAVFSQFQDERILLNRLAHVRPIDGGLELGTVAK